MDHKYIEVVEMRLKELDVKVEIIAKVTLNEIKLITKTYGELSNELKIIEKTILFNYGDKYKPVMKKMYELLEEEMKGLPLTSQSDQ